jgi:hypothetical protein
MAGVTADGNNHISGFSYDTSGNTEGDGINTYTWDGESQMKTAEGVTYAYDGDGRRAAKVVTQNPKLVPKKNRVILGRTVLERGRDNAKEGTHGGKDCRCSAPGGIGREGG